MSFSALVQPSEDPLRLELDLALLAELAERVEAFWIPTNVPCEYRIGNVLNAFDRNDSMLTDFVGSKQRRTVNIRPSFLCEVVDHNAIHQRRILRFRLLRELTPTCGTLERSYLIRR